MPFRQLVTNDMPELAAEMDADLYHQKEVTEAVGQFADPHLFWNPGTRSLVWEDETGDVLYINFALETRAIIQFKQGVSKERIRAAFKTGLPQIEEMLKKQDVKAIVYNSISPTLIWFMRLLGFRGPIKNEYRKLL